MICAKGSFGLKICVRPSAGALNTQKNIIGHQFRIKAGTAIGTVSLRVGVEARMRFGADRHALLDLEIEQDLVGVECAAEVPERRPLQTAVGRIAPIALQNEPPVLGADVQFVVVGVEQLDPVLSTFRKRNAVPHLLA